VSNSTSAFRLLDGANLLGTQNNVTGTVAVWKSPDSLFGLPDSPYGLSGPAAVVDYSSIVRGTIDGRVEFSVTSGSLLVSSLEQSSVMLMPPANGSFPTQFIRGTSLEMCRVP